VPRGNEVTLAFTGDSSALEKTFANVGGAATKMSGDLDKASSQAKSLDGSMGRVGSTIDSSESKFMGTADVLDGLATTMGLNVGAQIDMARGFGDIAGGLTNLAPLLSGVATKLGITTAATWAWNTAQTALNFVMSMNPIMLVVIAIGLLVAGLIVAWHHSETFRDIVRGAFDKVKEGVGDLITVMGTVAEALTAPYRLAFRAIKSLWNNTIGGFRFEVPSWIPGIGGNGFTIPRMHTGGVVPGPPGSEMLALLQAGERVTPAGQGGGTIIVINVSGVGMGRDFGAAVASALRDNALIGVG
jgi:hypothetical protein